MARSRSEIGRASRLKGKRGEREAAEWFSKVTGVPWMRVPLSGGLRLDFPFDLMKKGEARDKETIFDRVGISVKNTKRVEMATWIDEMWGECEDYFGNPLYLRWLIHFKLAGRNFVTVPREYFEELIKKH